MLSVVYTAIAAELVAINAYVVAPLIGEVHVRKNDAPPRMIFIPDADTFDAPIGPGGNPRPIHDVEGTTEVVIHGQTMDHVEGMRDQLVIALRHACKKASTLDTSNPNSRRAASYKLLGGKWTRNTLVATKGVEYRMRFSVRFPIVDRKWAAPTGEPPAPQEPLPATYIGEQAYTFPVVTGAELETVSTIGYEGADEANLVTIDTTEDP